MKIQDLSERNAEDDDLWFEALTGRAADTNHPTPSEREAWLIRKAVLDEFSYKPDDAGLAAALRPDEGRRRFAALMQALDAPVMDADLHQRATQAAALPPAPLYRPFKSVGQWLSDKLQLGVPLRQGLVVGVVLVLAVGLLYRHERQSELELASRLTRWPDAPLEVRAGVNVRIADADPVARADAVAHAAQSVGASATRYAGAKRVYVVIRAADGVSPTLREALATVGVPVSGAQTIVEIAAP